MPENRNRRGDRGRRTHKSAGSPSPLSGALRTGARAAKEVGHTVARRAADKAAELKRRAGVQSREFLASQTSAAADNLGQVGQVIRQAAARLQRERHEGVARYVRTAADGVDHAAQYLADHDPADLARDASRMVKRRPAWFLGAMLLAGLALGRFMKSGTAGSPAAKRRRTAKRQKRHR